MQLANSMKKRKDYIILATSSYRLRHHQNNIVVGYQLKDFLPVSVNGKILPKLSMFFLLLMVPFT
jgi:hypothetical protein